MRVQLKCDMNKECSRPVTHIGNKGFIYCKEHAIRRRQFGYEGTRQLSAKEMRTLQNGELEQIKY